MRAFKSNTYNVYIQFINFPLLLNNWNNWSRVCGELFNNQISYLTNKFEASNSDHHKYCGKKPGWVWNTNVNHEVKFPRNPLLSSAHNSSDFRPAAECELWLFLSLSFRCLVRCGVWEECKILIRLRWQDLDLGWMRAEQYAAVAAAVSRSRGIYLVFYAACGGSALELKYCAGSSCLRKLRPGCQPRVSIYASDLHIFRLILSSSRLSTMRA